MATDVHGRTQPWGSGGFSHHRRSIPISSLAAINYTEGATIFYSNNTFAAGAMHDPDVLGTPGVYPRYRCLVQHLLSPLLSTDLHHQEQIDRLKDHLETVCENLRACRNVKCLAIYLCPDVADGQDRVLRRHGTEEVVARLSKLAERGLSFEDLQRMTKLEMRILVKARSGFRHVDDARLKVMVETVMQALAKQEAEWMKVLAELKEKGLKVMMR